MCLCACMSMYGCFCICVSVTMSLFVCMLWALKPPCPARPCCLSCLRQTRPQPCGTVGVSQPPARAGPHSHCPPGSCFPSCGTGITAGISGAPTGVVGVQWGASASPPASPCSRPRLINLINFPDLSCAAVAMTAAARAKWLPRCLSRAMDCGRQQSQRRGDGHGRLRASHVCVCHRKRLAQPCSCARGLCVPVQATCRTQQAPSWGQVQI